MSTPTPVVIRCQALVTLDVEADVTAIASYLRSSSGDDHVRLAMFHAPESKLNPLINDGSKLVCWLYAESLITLNADGDAQELLVISWKCEGEATQYLTLCKGVTFHDGTALNTENAAATLTLAATAAKPPRVLDRVELTVKADGRDLFLTVAAPDLPMPQRLSSLQPVILSPAVYSSSADGAINPVGHSTDTSILKQANGLSGATLECNDTYWDTKAIAPGIDITYTPDGAAHASALRIDTADTVEVVPVAQVDNIDKNLLHGIITPRTSTLCLNIRSGPFINPALRAAARNAVDPTVLIKTVLEGHADLPVGLLGLAMFWTAELRAWKKETYFGTSDVAAIDRTPGAPAAGTIPAGTAITLTSYADHPELDEMVPLLAQQLKAIGFKITQDMRECNQIESEILTGKFHAVLVSHSTVLDFGDAVAYMTTDFSSSGSYSMSGLHGEMVDAAISKTVATQPGDEHCKTILATEQAIPMTGATILLVHEHVVQGEATGVTGAERGPGECALITSVTTVKE